MQKVHYQDDHPEVLEAAGGMRFQMFGHEGLTKSASEIFTKEAMAAYAPDDNHFGMHVVAMGSEESVGWNRNGDSFPEAALKKHHGTFVTNGHFYREHRNRCPDTQGIGMIKASAYNEDMSRVELLVWGDKRKAAASCRSP